jgi:flagellar biosynthesis/type III secretory pathway protein FliH
MSSVIKARGGAGVRPFGIVETPQPTRDQPAPRSQEAIRLEQLTQENLGLKEKLRDLSASLEGAVGAAREEGRREAAATAARDDEARVAALKATLGDALSAWENRLVQLESLAALISRTSLAKIFDRPESYSDLVLDCLAHQVRQIRREAVVAIKVSAADFPDKAQLERVSLAELPSVAVGPSTELGPGECRIDLQVGHIDAGPATQWRQLEALLHQIADEESA